MIYIEKQYNEFNDLQREKVFGSAEVLTNMRFIKYAFIEDKIENVHIFKTKDEPLNSPFVSDAFRQKILDSDLIGFRFELVWDSDGK